MGLIRPEPVEGLFLRLVDPGRLSPNGLKIYA